MYNIYCMVTWITNLMFSKLHGVIKKIFKSQEWIKTFVIYKNQNPEEIANITNVRSTLRRSFVSFF